MNRDFALNSALNVTADGRDDVEPQQDFPGFDLAWARSSPTHELSAHGRTVQRRLEAPAPRQARPSAWKRFRFALYRLRAGR